jgi:hypothetical protein
MEVFVFFTGTDIFSIIWKQDYPYKCREGEFVGKRFLSVDKLGGEGYTSERGVGGSGNTKMEKEL